MTAQDLKNSILQLAVQGKLVKQDPNDEPASELLKRIRAEKQRLVKEGKIKKDKNPSDIFIGSDKLPYEKRGEETHCIDDEIPFDIPDSWAWCRLGEIANWGSGATPNRNDPEYYKNGTVPWLKTGDLNDGIISIIPELITPKAVKETSVKLNPVGSVLIAMYGATIGKLGILGIEATTNQACCAGIVHNGIFNKYLFYYLMSQRDAFKRRGEGSGQPNISKEKIIETIFPLPPLNEQKRIVEKIEELLPYVEEYGKCEIELTTLNKNFPDALKKSILQWAVQGKLIDQDPNDEPADILLEKIRAEKEKLIKEGKIKRDKNASKIIRRGNEFYEKFPDGTETLLTDLPFDIPDSWTWCRLGEVVPYGECNSIDSQNIDKDSWILDLEDIEKYTGKIIRKVTRKERLSNSAKHVFIKGNVLYSKLRPYLNKVVIADNDGFCTSEILPLDFGPYIFNEYAKLFLMTPFFVNYTISRSYGIKMPRLGTTEGKKALFILPPFTEQIRIVNKIKTLFLQIDNFV